MRLLNIFGALSGLISVVILAASHHMFHDDPDVVFVYLAAALQLSSGLAALVLASRTGMLNGLAGALMLIGATLFTGEVMLSAYNDNHPFHMLAPIGGGICMLGWLVLAFARPN